jgi:hypothetical protein
MFRNLHLEENSINSPFETKTFYLKIGELILGQLIFKSLRNNPDIRLFIDCTFDVLMQFQHT